jgi:hypothetical protein
MSYEELCELKARYDVMMAARREVKGVMGLG